MTFIHVYRFEPLMDFHDYYSAIEYITFFISYRFKEQKKKPLLTRIEELNIVIVMNIVLLQWKMIEPNDCERLQLEAISFALSIFFVRKLCNEIKHMFSIVHSNYMYIYFVIVLGSERVRASNCVSVAFGMCIVFIVHCWIMKDDAGVEMILLE